MGPSSSGNRNSLLPKWDRKEIFTSEVLTSLDRGKISDRHATHTVASVVSATGLNLSELAITGSSGDRASLAALHKLKRHFWYLSEEVIEFSFFDDSISIEDKRKMVKSLDEGAEDPAKRISLSDNEMITKEIPDFVTKNIKKFFDTSNISTEFLGDDPTL